MSSIYERLLTKTADQLPHFYKKFSDQIINNEASLFIGAGVSRNSGYPGWADLLSECAEELNVDLNKIDLYSLAQYYANEHSDSDLRSIINNKINKIPQESNLLLNSLLEIGFNSIWTTNYDKSIETELGKKCIPHNIIVNDKNLASIDCHDNYDYGTGKVFTADETYIKIRGVKAYIWFIMDASKRSIIGNQVSDNRGVGPCILAMRMAFRHLKKLPENFHFIADGYSAYPLAAQQFFREFGDKFKFDITQVIGLTNDDEVSRVFRPYKQMIERLNRTYKVSYRPTNGFDNIDGANYDLALWVAYYNFLRPHKHAGCKVLNKVEMLEGAENMPGKWQLLIFLGQQTILNLQNQASA